VLAWSLEVLRTMRDKAAKIAADDAMPGRALSVVELREAVVSSTRESQLGTVGTNSLFDVLGNILISPLAASCHGPASALGRRNARSDLLNGILGHGLLGCFELPVSFLPTIGREGTVVAQAYQLRWLRTASPPSREWSVAVSEAGCGLEGVPCRQT